MVELKTLTNKILIGSKEISLKFLEITDAPEWKTTGFKVSNGMGEIGEIKETMEDSNYYLFVSRGLAGSLFVATANADHLGSEH